jgi:hypothetical protein
MVWLLEFVEDWRPHADGLELDSISPSAPRIWYVTCPLASDDVDETVAGELAVAGFTIALSHPLKNVLKTS